MNRKYNIRSEKGFLKLHMIFSKGAAMPAQDIKDGSPKILINKKKY
jgi:hypothetical protein